MTWRDEEEDARMSAQTEARKSHAGGIITKQKEQQKIKCVLIFRRNGH